MARFGYARVSLPGGCAIGARPIDLHIQALEKLGAEITVDHGYVEARAKRLRGTTFRFPKITVTGTENILTAAVLAEGETDPRKLRARAGNSRPRRAARENGREDRRRRHAHDSHPGRRKTSRRDARMIPDRIEAGTFLVAGAITGGELLLTECEPQHLRALIAKLKECGVEIHCEGKDAIRVTAAEKLVAADVTTEEYPGFATDMQAQFMALATQAKGVSHIRETIFENRYLHASEMMRMGANIAIDGNARHRHRAHSAQRRARHRFRPSRQRRAGACRARRRAIPP